MKRKREKGHTFEVECIFRDGHRRRMPMGPVDTSTSVAIAWGSWGMTPWVDKRTFRPRKGRPMLTRIFRDGELWREFDDDAGRHTFDADPPLLEKRRPRRRR